MTNTSDTPNKQRSVGGSRHMMLSAMFACACVTNFFVAQDAQSRRADVDIMMNALPQQAQSSEHHKPQYRQVHFLPNEQLNNIEDMFSATWLQPLAKFMQMDVQGIQTVEDGCFQAFRPDLGAVRMTLDWIDFSVEHMSKWWKIANVFGDDAIPFNKAVTSFQAYTRSAKMDVYELSPLRETFAMIAFQPYGNDRHPRSRPLTVSSLAATIASLMNVGLGRVVVAGLNDVDESIVQDTFRYLKDTLDKKQYRQAVNDTTPVTKIGPMEVGYVQVYPEEVKSKFLPVNIPRGALHVLQHAFKGDLDQNRTRDVMGTTTDKSHWKYVYLTEPDIILQTRPWVLPQLKNALDQGLVLAPHRLQPVPHEADFIGMKDEHHFIKAEGNFSTVLDLDSLDGAACCDEHLKDYKPWKDYFESCGTFWWECGFKQVGNKSHAHLTPYSLIRLTQGTGIVHLGATEHGRRCFPKTSGACVPPNDTSSVVPNS